MKKEILVIGVLVIIISALATTAYFVTRPPPAPPVAEIKVGILFPLTGGMAPFGARCTEAALLAIDAINLRGGVKGVKVMPVVADSQSDAKVAAAEVERLATVEKVNAIIGSYAGFLAMAATSAAEKVKIFYMEAIAAPNELTYGRGLKYSVRVAPWGMDYGLLGVEFAVKIVIPKLGLEPNETRVAVINEDGPYGTGVAAGCLEGIKKYGLQLVAHEPYSYKATDLSSLIMKLKEADPHILLATSYALDAQLFIRQSAELGFQIPAFIGLSAGYGLPSTAEAVGKLMDGIFDVDPLFPWLIKDEFLSPDAREQRDTFIRLWDERVRAKLGPMHGWEGRVWITVWTLLTDIVPRALDKYGSLDSESLRKAADETDIPDGDTIQIYGVKFAPIGDVNAGQNIRGGLMGVYQWWGGEARLVWPTEYALEKPVIPKPTW